MMQDLFNELWEMTLPLIEEFMVLVPLTHYSIQPGYKILLNIKVKIFAPSKFELESDIELFQIVEVKFGLACSVKRLLVQSEYCKVHQILIG